MQEPTVSQDKFLNYPTHRTVGFFDSPGVLRPLMHELTRFGLEKDEIDVLKGEEGINAVDHDGSQHGIYARWMRISQRFFHTGEWELIELADAELRQGHALVAVLTPNELEKDEVVRLMRKFGGHDIKYFDPWYVEHFPDII